MGIRAKQVRFLLHVVNQGATWRRALMIGRQRFYVTADELLSLAHGAGRELSREDAERICGNANGFAEPFLQWLSIPSVRSLDASPFEGADVIHDMTVPVPAELHRTSDLVLDVGTLEHIYDPVQALRNYKELVDVGGSIVVIAPTNNMSGHGFYQFSPEFMFGTFGRGGGFVVESCFVAEDDESKTFYQAADPRDAQARVEFRNYQPTMLYLWARRVGDAVDQPAVIQADYERHWREENSDGIAGFTSNGLRGRLRDFAYASRERQPWKVIFDTYGGVMSSLRYHAGRAYYDPRMFRKCTLP